MTELKYQCLRQASLIERQQAEIERQEALLRLQRRLIDDLTTANCELRSMRSTLRAFAEVALVFSLSCTLIAVAMEIVSG